MTTSEHGASGAESPLCLNAFPILNANELTWKLNTFVVDPTSALDTRKLTATDRCAAVSALRNAHDKCFVDAGFAIPIVGGRVATPESWNLPSGEIVNGRRVVSDGATIAGLMNEADGERVGGILACGIERLLETRDNNPFGAVWRENDHFCIWPDDLGDDANVFCPGFFVSPKLLAGGKWSLQIGAATIAVERETLGAYYAQGHVRHLVKVVKGIIEGNACRKMERADTRVLHVNYTDSGAIVKPYWLADPEEIINHGRLATSVQRSMTNDEALVFDASGARHSVPLNELHLIFGTRVREKGRTSPYSRPDAMFAMVKRVRDFLDGSEIFGRRLLLGPEPYVSDAFRRVRFTPPSLMVRKGEGVAQVGGDGIPSDAGFRRRANSLNRSTARWGWLKQGTIRPVIAWPHAFDYRRALRMQQDFVEILAQRKLPAEIEVLQYNDARDLLGKLSRSDYDAVVVVLPEPSATSSFTDDVRKVIVASAEQPVEFLFVDQTLSGEWVRKSPRELKRVDPALRRAVRDVYGNALSALLLKKGWLPYVPSESFNYNVHVAIATGPAGLERPYVCVGHGFAQLGDNPDGFSMVARELRARANERRPIPTHSLYAGLLDVIEQLHDDLSDFGWPLDLERVLFVRGGGFLASDAQWNELEAIRQLRNELVGRNWASASSCWTSAEVHRRAGDWRLFSTVGESVTNPLPGECLQVSSNPNEALLVTTGRPDLTSVVSPLLRVRIEGISGATDVQDAVRDIYWQSALGVKAANGGHRMPWVLQVAEEGAVQSAIHFPLGAAVAS